jgi:hypothetical protein
MSLDLERPRSGTFLQMEHYRTYLRAELGKLGNIDDSRDFLERSGCRVEAFDLVGDADWLAGRFASQDRVDAFVAELSARALQDLTACCDRWRKNGISTRLSPRQTPASIEVPVERILLSQAEPSLGPVFARYGGRLIAIAQDEEVLAADAYRSRRPGDEVDFRRCLASPEPGSPGMYRVFDGMHRAIQMARNGDARISVCVVDGP